MTIPGNGISPPPPPAPAAAQSSMIINPAQKSVHLNIITIVIDTDVMSGPDD